MQSLGILIMQSLGKLWYHCGGSDLGSDLGSLEDAAGYHLRQQLRAAAAAAAAALAAAAELRACEAQRDRALVERDRAIAAAAELRVAVQRGEALSLRNAGILQTARLRIRADRAAECRSDSKGQ